MLILLPSATYNPITRCCDLDVSTGILKLKIEFVISELIIRYGRFKLHDINESRSPNEFKSL